MKISYTDWWNDIVAIVRSNASIVLAVAGAFAFLPGLVGAFTAVPYVPPADGADLPEAIAAFSQFFSDNWLQQTAVILLSTLGQLMLYIVLLDPRRPAVGEALRMAAMLFIPFLLTNILVGIIVGVGFVLLIIPGLYLIGRVALSTPSLVAERSYNPVAAVGRSWALTKGQGWRIFFFAFLIFLVAFVVQVAIGGTLGTVLGLIAGDGGQFSIGKLLLAALEALFASVFFILSVALWVALYRRLANDPAKTFS